MLKSAFFFVALTAVGSVAAAEPTPTAPNHQSQVGAKPAKEKKICKMIGEQEIGSRFGSDKVCKTAAEWKKLEEKQLGKN